VKASRLAEQLGALEAMSPVQLHSEWQRLYKLPAPRVSPGLLARGIAYRLQKRALGGLPPSAVRELARVAEMSAGGGGQLRQAAVPTTVTDLRPGTTLMRSWGDRMWSVLVTEEGLVFDGRRYASLSQIAREITGAHWSGPRFFGLTSTGAVRAKAAAHG
jgi:hypothetical protein